MKRKVLIVDDESRMRVLISDFLVNEGYDVVEAVDGEEAIDKFTEDSDIDLIILDVMMPGYNGWEVCEEIRSISSVPIIMVTAKNTESDELQGFVKGADEYIKKPFSLSILMARVNALMKRSGAVDENIEKGIIEIDRDKHRVKCGGATVDLSSKEYKLLVYMMESEDAVLSRDQLLDNVWGFDYEGTDRTVDTHINRLRDKLNDAGSYIRTIRGYGYKFEVTE